MTPLRAHRLQLCVPVALLFALIAGCGGAHARYISHFERGRHYLEQGNLDKAGIEFRNALQIQPKDPDALYFIGRVAEQRRNFREAAGFYEAAIDARSDFDDARAHLGKLLVYGGMSQRALEVLAPGLLRHPDGADLLAARAAAEHQSKDDAAARADAERAVQVAPANENAVAVLAALYADEHEYSRAASVVNDAVSQRPNSVDLREVLTNLYLVSGQPQKAEEQMRRIIELRPDDIEPREQLAAHLRRAHEPDAAQSVLEQAVAEFAKRNESSKADRAKLLLVDFLAAERSRAQAEKTLREFISREPDNHELRFGLAALLQRTGASEDAIAEYQAVIEQDKLGARGLAARDRIAAIQLARGEEQQARQLIGQVLERNPRDDDALIMRADIELRGDDPTSAIADLRAALRDQPRSVVLQRALAKAYLQKGEAVLAEEALKTAIDTAPDDVAARTELARQLAGSGRSDEAIALLREGLRRSPQSAPLRITLIGLYLTKKDAASARAIAEELKAAQPASPAGFYFAGLAALQQGRLEDSARELDRALVLKPGDLDTLQVFVRVDAAAAKPERSLARVQSAIEHDPRDAQLANLLGELLAHSKDFSRAVDAYKRASALQPRWWVPYRNLALAHQAQGDTAEAITDYQAGLKAAPLELPLAVDAALFLEKQGRIEEAMAAYQTLYRGNPRARRLAANNLAMLLVTYRTDRASLDQALNLTSSFASSEDSSLLDTSGWVRFKRGEYRDALPVLERASAKAPDSRLIRYHLAMTELRLGMKERARTHLESALAGSGEFSGAEEARSALAALSPRPG